MTTTTINPDALRSYTRVAAGQPTEGLLLAVKYADRPEIFLAAITELRGRDDYRAMIDADHTEALGDNAVRHAVQKGDILAVHTGDADLTQSLYARGLIERLFRLDFGGRVVWPLTEAGMALRERLLDSPTQTGGEP